MAAPRLNRLQAERQAHWHYSRKFAWCKRCVYCGMAADTLDHVFPISIAAGLELARPGVRKALGQGLNLVPACRDCNQRAGRRPFISIREKREFIQEKLRRRLAADLAGQDWDDEDLSELGHMLRVEVVKGIRAQKRALMRCNWPLVRSDQ